MRTQSRPGPPLRAIVNPASGGGRGRRAADQLLAVLGRRGVGCEARWTEAPGHATELAAAAASDGVERIVAVGGDGTVHEVAQGMLDSASNATPELALLPVGTGNDFHRMVGGAKGADAVADTLMRGVVRRFDVGRVRWSGGPEDGERYFVNLLGMGIDADILRLRSRFTRLPGLLQYLAALLNAMIVYRPLGVDIRTPGDRIRDRTTLSVITVGPSIGGGFMINPEADASDGWLNLCHAGRMNPLQLLALVPQVVRGTHAGSRHVRMRRVKEATLRRQDGEPFWFELDGELSPGAARELRVDVVPRALPVVTPPGA